MRLAAATLALGLSLSAAGDITARPLCEAVGGVLMILGGMRLIQWARS